MLPLPVQQVKPIRPTNLRYAADFNAMVITLWGSLEKVMGSIFMLFTMLAVLISNPGNSGALNAPCNHSVEQILTH